MTWWGEGIGVFVGKVRGSMRASFFFNETATTEVYTLSLPDALPIFGGAGLVKDVSHVRGDCPDCDD